MRIWGLTQQSNGEKPAAHLPAAQQFLLHLPYTCLRQVLRSKPTAGASFSTITTTVTSTAASTTFAAALS